MTHTASCLGLLVIVAGCGSSAAGGGSGGSSGSGGALGGSGGRGGGAGGNSGTGGGGGQLGTGGDHGGTGGSTSGAGGAGSGGSGGAAGQGAGGSQGYDCTGVTLDGDCSTYPTGLVCVLPGEGPLPCVCLPASGGPKWQCGGAGAPCSVTAGGGDCSLSTITTITNFGGCKYPPATVCSCEAADGGAAWSCNNSACPATPPTGSCAGSPAAGLNCSYAGTSISCDCGSTGAGAPRWLCNGKTTPDCPSSWPGSGVDCSSFQPGTVCSFPAGNVTGGPCTCASDGTGLTWHCSNG